MSDLQEEGRTISTATAAKLRAAHEAIGALLAMVKAEESDDADAVESDDMALAEEHIELIERAVDDGGVAHIRLIAPGWGSSGYYSPDVLRRDGPKVFRQGLQMHLDHQTEREARERPEGSVRTLAGVLASDARWEDDGAAGPGLYADARVFEQHRPMLNEMAPHIGVSIRASGKATRGEAEGRKGHIIGAITVANTTDYVTRAGAGGVILPLTESAADGGVGLTLFRAQERPENDTEANMAENTELDELRAEVARLREALLLREARDVVIEALAKVDMPEPTRARLTESLAKAPPMKRDVEETGGKDGYKTFAAKGAAELDTEKLLALIAEAAKAELAYIARVSGGGAVRGMGTSAAMASTGVGLKESFKTRYLRQGMALDEADRLAASAASGR